MCALSYSAQSQNLPGVAPRAHQLLVNRFAHERPAHISLFNSYVLRVLSPLYYL
jgi:hypothetical protein